ncbi:MAG: dihydroneopterin aldolase [Chthoniobacterales bacterium]|nr:dihydroneopterin aldolase [Chthoniobacterales bacterium]
MADEIHIEQLAVDCVIGVPDEERQRSQRLVFSITLVPEIGFVALGDDLARTVDYAAVADAVRVFVQRRVVKLIETLADELAAHLLERFPLHEVRIELRKFILPDTNFVAVRITRRAVSPVDS